MIKCYSVRNGELTVDEDIVNGTLVTMTDPSEEEILRVASSNNIDPDHLFSASDIDEVSRIEIENNVGYFYIDIPYVDESENYDTIPLLMVLIGERYIAVCRKNTGLIDRFLRASAKNKSADQRLTNILFLKTIIMEYQKDLRMIEKRRMEIEKNNRARKVYEDDIVRLHDLENSLVYFSTSLNGLSAVIGLIKERLTDDMCPKVREIYDDTVIECKQAQEMASIYRSVTQSTRELIITKINLRTNERMKRLTDITITLTIPMIITGAYGMNVDLPFQDQPWAFVGIFGGSLALCLIVNRILKKVGLT